MNNNRIVICFIVLFVSSFYAIAQTNSDREIFAETFVKIFENRGNRFDSITKFNVTVGESFKYDVTIKMPGAAKCFISDQKFCAEYKFKDIASASSYFKTLQDWLNYVASAYKSKILFVQPYINPDFLRYYLSDSSAFIDAENTLSFSKDNFGNTYTVKLVIDSKPDLTYYTNYGSRINNPAINSLIKEVGFSNDMLMIKIKKNKKTSTDGYNYESSRTLPEFKASIFEYTDEYSSENILQLVTKWNGEVKTVNQKVDSLILMLKAALPSSFCYRIDAERQTIFFNQNPFANEKSDVSFSILYGLDDGKKNSYFTSLLITRTVEKEQDVKIKVEKKELYPFKEASGKYGYKDQSDKIVVAAKYDKAEDFAGERGHVVLNNKHGFIDISGKEIIPLQFDFASNFVTDGLAEVLLNRKYGMIDKSGKITIPIQYDEIDRGDLYYNEKGSFHRRTKFIMVKQNSKYGFVDSAGRVAVPLKYEYAKIIANLIARVKINNKEGVIDYTGKEIVPIVYDAMNTDDYSKLGIIRVKQNGKWGLVDKSGKLIIAANYDYTADVFSEGLAWVRLNDKAGFVDKSGKEIIPLKYNGVGNFSNGLASARLNEKCGYIDKTGKEIIAFKYENGGSFAQGLAAVKINGKWGYIDKTGKTVIPFKYDGAEEFDKNGEAKVYIGKKWGKINKKGEIVKTIVNENDDDDWEY